MVFSAISTALSYALASAVFAQPKFTNAEEIKKQKPENKELLTENDIANFFGDLINLYNGVQKNYKNFSIKQPFGNISDSEMLYFLGSNLPRYKDNHNNTPLTRLVANQRHGAVEAIINEVEDRELLKANPDLTKRFLNSCDKNGINFLEMSSRFYGVMPEKLLEKVVSLYAKNAEADSIKLTPAILSLPEDLFNSLLPKIDKKNIEEFTNPNIPEREIYEKIVASRKEVGLSPLVIYVKKGYENSVLVNYNPKNDGLPDQGQRKITDDNFFEFQDLRTGTIASKKLAKMGEEIIREKFTRNDLNKEDKDSIINALINKNPTATRMAKKNAESNLSRLKLDFCPSTKPNSIGGQPMDYSKIANSKVEGMLP